MNQEKGNQKDPNQEDEIKERNQEMNESKQDQMKLLRKNMNQNRKNKIKFKIQLKFLKKNWRMKKIQLRWEVMKILMKILKPNNQSMKDGIQLKMRN